MYGWPTHQNSKHFIMAKRIIGPYYTTDERSLQQKPSVTWSIIALHLNEISRADHVLYRRKMRYNPEVTQPKKVDPQWVLKPNPNLGLTHGESPPIYTKHAARLFNFDVTFPRRIQKKAISLFSMHIAWMKSRLEYLSCTCAPPKKI